MFVEIGVLGGEDRVDDGVGDVFEADRLAVALAQLAEQYSVRGVDLRQAADGRELEYELVRVAQPAFFEISDCAECGIGLEDT